MSRWSVFLLCVCAGMDDFMDVCVCVCAFVRACACVCACE